MVEKQMKITKRQLRRIIREEQADVTPKYDKDSALVGGQSRLHDKLQKAIIDKTVEDREEAKEKEAKEKSESIRITKTQLRRIIKEEKAKLLKEAQSTFDGHPSPVAGKTYSRQSGQASAGDLEFALDEYGKLRMNQEPLTARDLENEVTMILEKWLDDVTLPDGQVDTSRWGGLG
jgi:hypothetical protein